MYILVEMLTKAILPRLDMPYAFFGHSMGAIICFELARQLRRSHGSEPVYLFVSGHRAPQIPKTSPQVHELPDSEFIRELENLGTSKDLLNSAELLAMLLPVIRADYKMIESYSYTGAPPLTCPIMAFGGVSDDGVPREHLEEWKEQTVKGFGVRMIPGDHFFIHTEEASLLKIIFTELKIYC
jgi:medium-chain acyl-[acyl-carrier-protein] hydrolase